MISGLLMLAIGHLMTTAVMGQLVSVRHIKGF